MVCNHSVLLIKCLLDGNESSMREQLLLLNRKAPLGNGLVKRPEPGDR